MNTHNTSVMLEALCAARGIDVSAATSHIPYPSPNVHSSHVISDMLLQSEGEEGPDNDG